jgi:hypothetical protein
MDYLSQRISPQVGFSLHVPGEQRAIQWTLAPTPARLVAEQQRRRYLSE